MIALRTGPLPTMALLFGACFWGVVWYPLRLLDHAGLDAAWQILVFYTAASVLLVPFVRGMGALLRAYPGILAALMIASGWTNVAFVLAVLAGEVVRVLLLFYMAPLWTVMLGRWVLGERWHRGTLGMLVLGLGGMVLMLWRPSAGAAAVGIGDVLALTAGMAFAYSNVLVRQLPEIGVMAKTQVAWLGVVLTALVAILLGDRTLPAVAWEAWLAAIGLGLSGFFAATLLVVYGVSRMPVQRSSVIMLSELLIGAVSAAWLADETMSLREWLGGGLIIAAGLVAIFHPATEDA